MLCWLLRVAELEQLLVRAIVVGFCWVLKPGVKLVNRCLAANSAMLSALREEKFQRKKTLCPLYLLLPMLGRFVLKAV